ncbi:MAG: iron-containing alcohol dehydrogenase [Clostridiales bacterium]|nr:iron-containing alcohol dehydrogenase [Clostridiales bacterium]
MAVIGTKEQPIRRACLVCDPFLVKNGAAGRVTGLLDAMGAQWEIFDQVIPNPTVELVSQGVAHILDYQPDTVIALGGGSAIDTGKAISFIYTNATGAEKPRCIAIPTTSGTGSEVTSFSVLSDPSAGAKYPLVDNQMLPEVALLDPSLTVSVPPQVTADTGLDVLTHAAEAYASTGASDFTDALAEKACALVLEHLPRAVKNGEDLEAREKLHAASCMAGMAFNSAGLGMCHAMAHALGEQLHLPHGRCNALLLPHVIGFNAGLGETGSFSAQARYAALAKRMGLCCYNEGVAVRSLIKQVQELMSQVSIAPKLAEQAQREELRGALEQICALAQKDSCLESNPRPASAEQMASILSQL